MGLGIDSVVDPERDEHHTAADFPEHREVEVFSLHVSEGGCKEVEDPEEGFDGPDECGFF